MSHDGHSIQIGPLPELRPAQGSRGGPNHAAPDGTGTFESAICPPKGGRYEATSAVCRPSQCERCPGARRGSGGRTEKRLISARIFDFGRSGTRFPVRKPLNKQDEKIRLHFLKFPHRPIRGCDARRCGTVTRCVRMRPSQGCRGCGVGVKARVGKGRAWTPAGAPHSARAEGIRARDLAAVFPPVIPAAKPVLREGGERESATFHTNVGAGVRRRGRQSEGGR